jgi:hypothetical protein
MARPLSWLDSLLFGFRAIWHGNAQMPERSAIEFAGAGVTVEDDAATKRTKITIPGASGAVASVSAVAPLGNTGTATAPVIEMTGVISNTQHGSRVGGTLHATATTSTAGFMSAADKTKLDAVPAAASIATTTYVDNSIAAVGAGLDADTAVLENASVALNSNGVPIQNMPNGLAFTRLVGGGIAMQVGRGEASSTGVYDVLRVIAVNNGGGGAVGLGTALSFGGQDDSSDEPDLARIAAVMTDPTNGTHRAQLRFYAANGDGTADHVLGAWDPDAGLSVEGTITKVGTAAGTTITAGIIAENTTQATNVAQTQKGFGLVSAGTAWDSDDSTFRRVRGMFYIEPRPGSTVGYYWRLAIDAGAGTWSDTGLFYTNSDPGLFQEALVAPTFMANAGGSGFQQRAFGSVDGTTAVRGGCNYDGADTMRFFATGSDQKLALRTNATNRVVIDASGNQVHTLPATSTIRTQWGTAGVNYTDDAADVQTTTNATPTNIWTFTMDDKSSLKFDVDVYCYVTTNAAFRAYFGKIGGFARNGGGATADFTANKHPDQVIGGWGVPPTVALVAGPGANEVSVQVTGTTDTIKWIAKITYQVGTTSA